MLIGSAVHARTLPLCERLNYREWSGFYAVGSYEAHHEHEYNATLAGALDGLGCGLVADAGLRLFCEYAAPSHVLFGHGGGIVAAMALGAVIAKVIPRG